MSSGLPRETFKQIQTVDLTPFIKRVQIGIQSFKWYTFFLVGVSLIGLVITHVLVLSNTSKYLPAPTNNNYPADDIAIADFVLVSLLALGLVSALRDTSNLFKTIQKSITVDRENSKYFNPVEEDDVMASSSRRSGESFNSGSEISKRLLGLRRAPASNSFDDSFPAPSESLQGGEYRRRRSTMRR